MLRCFLLATALLMGYCAVAQSTFKRYYGGADDDFGTDGIRTDTAYYMVGLTNSYGAGGSDWFLMRADTNGVMQWFRTYGGSGTERSPVLKQTPDGNFVMFGATGSFGGNDFLLIKVKPNGDVIWSKTYDGGNDWAGHLTVCRDSGFIMSGYVNSGHFLAKADASGNLEWSKRFDGLNNDFGDFALQLNDGSFVMIGYAATLANGSNGLIAFRVDSLGNLIWFKGYDFYPASNKKIMMLTHDHHIVIAGNQIGGPGPGGSMFVMQIDTSGNLMWYKTHNGMTGRAVLPMDIMLQPDSTFVISGWTRAFKHIGGYTLTGNPEMFLTRISPKGNSIWLRIHSRQEYIGDAAGVWYDRDERYTIFGSGDLTAGQNREAILIQADRKGRNSCSVDTFFTVDSGTLDVYDTVPAISNIGTAVTRNIAAVTQIAVSSEWCAQDCPVALFSADTVCQNTPTTYTNLSRPYSSSATITGYSWKFQGGSTSTNYEPVFTRTVPGVFVDTLIAYSSNCSDTFLHTVWVKAAPVVAASKDTAICSGDTVSLSAQGGHTYAWSPTAVLSSPLAAQTLAWPTATTTFSVSATDTINGCTAVDTVKVTVSTPINPIIAATPDDCLSGKGSLSATPSGGIGPYLYQWNTNPAQFTASATNLFAGTYQVVVSDQIGCTDTATGTVTSPPPLQLSIQMDSALCANTCSGKLAVSATGGTSPYTYAWSNSGTTATISNLCTGTYMVTVVDAKGCSIMDTSTVLAPPALTLGVIVGHVDCYGQANGGAIATAQGGQPGYQWDWNRSSSNTNTANGLDTGMHVVQATDQHGCIVKDTFQITQPAMPALVTASILPKCHGVLGKAYASASGGTGPWSFEWSTNPPQYTDTAFSLVPGQYIVTATDANLCELQDTITITQPSALVTSLQLQHNSCYDSAYGQAALTVSGGTQPYVIVWSTGNTGSTTLANLVAGQYQVTVTDTHSCADTAVFFIQQPDSLTAQFVMQAANCGQSDGQLVATPSGGTPTYSRRWLDGQGNTLALGDTLQQIPAGNYRYEVTDANGCIRSWQRYVPNVAAPVAVVDSVRHPNCHDAKNGLVRLTVSGGNPGYSYLWSNGETTNPASQLPQGNYDVTITDQSGCIAITGGQLIAPAPLLASKATKPEHCNLGDGQAIISASGGTAPYSWQWHTGATTDTLDGIAAGSYRVMTTDSQGCQRLDTLIIAAIAGPQLQWHLLDAIRCYDTCNASLEAQALGGTQPLVWLWHDGSNLMQRNGLCAGQYQATITDSAGCTAFDSIVLAQPQPLIVNSTIQEVRCYQGSDGAILSSAQGGTPGYQFNWTHGPSGPQVTGLPAGTYEVIARDQQQCEARDTVVLAEPAALAIQLSITHTRCYDSADGSILASGSGGTGPYAFTWQTQPKVFNALLSQRPAGNYMVHMVDSLGCLDSVSGVISQPPPFQAQAFSDSVTCHGQQDGRAFAVVTGGTGAISLTWQTPGPVSGDTLYMQGSGWKHFTTSDSLGCPFADSVFVDQPAPLGMGLTLTNPKCFDELSGSITAIGTGGTPPYAFNWSSGVGIGGQRDSLGAGTTSVTVTDRNGCLTVDSATLSNPPLLSITMSSRSLRCRNLPEGVAYAAIQGGTGASSIAWHTTPQQFGDSATGLDSGMVSATVTDQNGCIARDSVLVDAPAALVMAAYLVTPVQCNGLSDGSAAVSYSGGTPGYTINWLTTPTQTADTAVALSAGSYQIQLRDSAGCLDTAEVNIPEPLPLAIDIDATDLQCYEDSSGVIMATATGGTPGYTYQWSHADTGAVSTLLPVGSYAVTVQDANGCTTDTSGIVLTQPEPIVVDAGEDLTVLEGSWVTLEAVAWPAASYQWQWLPESGLSTPLSYTTSLTATDSIQLVVYAMANGCLGTDTVLIFVIPDADFVLPSVFTPNGDGINDYWPILPRGLHLADLKIFNRWGQLIHDGPQPWEGMFKGRPQPLEVYVYQIEVGGPSLVKTIILSGNLTLIR